MRWGTEVWDRFEDVATYVQKGIDFCERYEEFWKRRTNIENSYAKSLRKLVETFEPKKKDTSGTHSLLAGVGVGVASSSIDTCSNGGGNSYESSSTFRCFVKMLSELRDVAGQHELIAENVSERVLTRLSHTLRTLKEERKRCIDDKERHLYEHLSSDDLMDKCKLKYERAWREVERAEEQLQRVENDDSASKNDIKKQKSIVEQKRRVSDALEAEYAKQLGEANRVKQAFYTEHLPSVFDTLQSVDVQRIERFKESVHSCVQIEMEVLPRIRQCYDEIELAANSVDPEEVSYNKIIVVLKYCLID